MDGNHTEKAYRDLAASPSEVHSTRLAETAQMDQIWHHAQVHKTWYRLSLGAAVASLIFCEARTRHPFGLAFLAPAGLADALIGQQKIYAAAHHLCSATELAFAVGRETLASAKLGPGGVIAFGPKFAFEQ